MNPKLFLKTLLTTMWFMMVVGCGGDTPEPAPAPTEAGVAQVSVEAATPTPVEVPTQAPAAGFTPTSKCLVPDVIGLDVAVAESSLAGPGLQPVKDFRHDESVAENAIISQDPPAGTTLELCQGDVVVVVSLGAVPVPTETPHPTDMGPVPTVDIVESLEQPPAATVEALEARYQRAIGLLNIQQWADAQAELWAIFDINPNYKDVQTQLVAVNAEVAKLVPTPTPISEIFTLEPDYDSGWVADNRNTNHRTLFRHELGVIPSQMTIFFSPSESHETVYPLLWPWGEDRSGNPVTVEVNSTQLVLNIWSGRHLHGAWRGDTDQWIHYDFGYWRVLLWR